MLYRTMKIFLVCDRNSAIHNPSFTFDGENKPFEYVSIKRLGTYRNGRYRINEISESIISNLKLLSYM